MDDDEEPAAPAGALHGLTHDLGLKALALLLAVVLWLVVEVWRPTERRGAPRGDHSGVTP